MSSAVEILDTDKVVAETKQDSKKVADGSQAFDGNSDVELSNGRSYDTEHHSSSDDDLPANKPSLMKRRICTDGLPLVLSGLVVLLLGALILVAVTIPTTYMGIGPLLAQDVVDRTWITMADIRISQWANADPANGTDPACAQYFPASMIVTQNLNFANIPWYGQLGPAYIMPSTLELYFNNTFFARLYLPKIDMRNPENSNVWANNTESPMVVYDAHTFLKANADLMPVDGFGKGWTLWTQKADIVVEQTLLGITMYYPAYMEQEINVTKPDFLDGPMSRVNDDIFTAMMCVES